MLYNIWIIPPEPVYGRLKNIIGKLGRNYDGPIFDPHMTLLGRVDKSLSEIEEKSKKLVTNIDSLELTLGPISFSTTYFQSVFVRINSTAKLMKLNLEAKKLFGMENNVFMPHMSLIYGDHGVSIREEIASKIKIPRHSFVVSELVISLATPNTSEWKTVATIPFGANK